MDWPVCGVFLFFLGFLGFEKNRTCGWIAVLVWFLKPRNASLAIQKICIC